MILNDKSLSAVQRTAVADVMEIMKYCGKSFITILLEESDWMTEVALPKWCDHDVGSNDGESLSAKSVRKGSSDMQASPSCTKRLKSDMCRKKSPEEALEDARSVSADCSLQNRSAQSLQPRKQSLPLIQLRQPHMLVSSNKSQILKMK